MARTTHETYLHGGTVRRESLAAAGDDDDGFGGIAVSDGDVLYTTEDPPRPFLVDGDELAKAEFSPAAEVLTKDHPQYDGGSPPVDDTVGALDTFGYSPDGGGCLAYFAKPHDRDIISGVRAGNYDVSISADFALDDEDTDPETGLPIARDWLVHDLSVVSLGQSDSNTAQWGGRREAAAMVHDRERFSSVLASVSGDDSPTPPADPETFAERLWDRFSSLAGGGDGDDDVDAQNGDDPGGNGTGRDADADTDTMDRDTLIERLADGSFSEDQLEDMSDATLKSLGTDQQIDGIDEFDPRGGDGTSDPDVDADPDDDGAPTPGDDDAFLATEEAAEAWLTEQLDERQSQTTKAELTSGIIANSDEYDDDDREHLEASSQRVLEKMHARVTKPRASGMPQTGGARSTALASAGGSDDEDDLDAYGTGVSE